MIHTKPAEIAPGVLDHRPSARPYPEHNWNPGLKIVQPAGTIDDYLPEDSALVINTAKGLVVITGCGHAGIINICTYARSFLRPARFHAIIGGIHLYNAPADRIQWTADQLNGFGIDNLIGAHCTGIETLMDAAARAEPRPGPRGRGGGGSDLHSRRRNRPRRNRQVGDQNPQAPSRRPAKRRNCQTVSPRRAKTTP